MLDFYSYYLQPQCHKIGLTLDQFWNDDPQLYFAYLEAYNKSEINNLQMQYNLAHINGVYTMMALGQMFSKKQIFPKEPFKVDAQKPKTNSILEENEKMKGYLMKNLKF